MSRHGGSRSGRGIPEFQIVVQDYASWNKDALKTVLVSDGDGGKQKLDILKEIPCRTLLHRVRDYKAAIRWGERFGTVLERRKVSREPYLKNAEYLNLNQKPVSIQMEPEFVINKAMELTREPQREQKIRIEIVDKEPEV